MKVFCCCFVILPSTLSGFTQKRDSLHTEQLDQVAGGDPFFSRGLYPDDSKYLNYAVYSLHQLKLDAWQFSFGSRFNGFQIKVADEVPGNVSVKPQALVGNTSVSYLLHEHSNFYTSFHSGFRTPNITDKNYRIHGSGINGVGRSLWLTLTGKF